MSSSSSSPSSPTSVSSSSSAPPPAADPVSALAPASESAPAPRPLVGEAGRAELRRLLPTGGLKALPAFQAAQALRIPGVNAAAFDALQACGVTRHTAHGAIFQRLAQSLLEQAATAPRDRLLALLAQAFPYISVDELRPIIVTIMESLGSALPRAYITGLVAAPTIVRQLRSPALRRAVRIESAAMFQLELAPLIVAFVAEQQPHAFTPLLHVANLKQLRERSRALPAICDMIGDSTTLYARCVEWLLHLYADNQFASDPAIRAALTEPVPGHGDAASTTTTATSIDLSNGASPVAIDAAMCADLLALRASPVALCALRFDLLMALHDRQQFRVAAADGAHGAAWLIDSCFRDGRFNSDVLARLRQCLRPADAARAAAAGTQQHKIIVADGASNAAHLAMVCASPSVRAQLLASIAQCLDVCASLSSSSSSSSSLSSDCTQHASLRALSDLLSLSSTAAEVVRQRGAGGFPQTSGDLVHVFYPAVVAWLQVDVPAASAGTAAGAAAVGAGAEPVPPPPAALAQIFAADLTCREILYHVMLLLIARGDRASVRRASSLMALLRLVPSAVWADAHSPESSIYAPFFAQALTGSGLAAALGSGHNGSGGSIVSNALLDCGPILSVLGSLWGHSRVVDSTLCALFASLWPTLTNANSVHAHAYASLCADVSRMATERSVLDATTRAAHPNLFGSGSGSVIASGAGRPASDAMND